MSGNLFGGSANTVQTQSTQAPWAGQQPFLSDIFSQANGLYGRGAYQGPFIGQQSPYTVQGQQYAAQQSSPGGVMYDTAQGKYLNPNTNPYFSQGLSDSLGLAGSAFARQYGGPGGQNLDNSGYQEALARGLGGVASQAYSNLYNTERQNQLNAVNQNAANLYGAGQSAEQRSQLEAGAQQQAYMSPWSNLANYKNAVSGNYGSQGTATEPFYTNPLSNIFGLGLGAYGLGRGMGWFGG